MLKMNHIYDHDLPSSQTILNTFYNDHTIEYVIVCYSMLTIKNTPVIHITVVK